MLQALDGNRADQRQEASQGLPWAHSDEFISARRQLEARFNRAPRAAISFDDVCAYNTGKFMPSAAWGMSQLRNKLLAEQTEHMADALERQGIHARYESSMVEKSLVTGVITPVTAWRNICFLPLVAQKNRRDMLNDLGYYLENIDPSPYWRYGVITFGERIPAFGDLHGAITRANEQIARWKERVLNDLGIDLGFVGLEFPRDADGTYHLHANVLYKPPFFADGGEEFRRRTHQHFGTWWRDNGRIRNLNELVKYPFKPNSIKGASDEEIAWLMRSTFNRRIIRIVGPIATFRSGRKEAGHRVFKLKGQYRLREVGSITFEDRGLSEQEYLEQQEDGDRPGGKSGDNILVAKIAPNFSRTPWAEPSVLIMNYNPQPAEKQIKARRRLETLWGWIADHRAAWDVSGAPEPLVALEVAEAIRDGLDPAEILSNQNGERSPQYMVHNGTISPQTSDEDLLIDEEDSNILIFPPPDQEDLEQDQEQDHHQLDQKTENSPGKCSGIDYLAVFDRSLTS